MKNCEFAVGLIVGLIVCESCQKSKFKRPIKPALPCESNKGDSLHLKPPPTQHCPNCYYQRYKKR